MGTASVEELIPGFQTTEPTYVPSEGFAGAVWITSYCGWSRYWLESRKQGDGASLAAATDGLVEVAENPPPEPRYPADDTSDRDIAAAARAGEPKLINQFFVANCTEWYEPGGVGR